MLIEYKKDLKNHIEYFVRDDGYRSPDYPLLSNFLMMFDIDGVERVDSTFDLCMELIGGEIDLDEAIESAPFFNFFYNSNNLEKDVEDFVELHNGGAIMFSNVLQMQRKNKEEFWKSALIYRVNTDDDTLDDFVRRFDLRKNTDAGIFTLEDFIVDSINNWLNTNYIGICEKCRGFYPIYNRKSYTTGKYCPLHRNYGNKEKSISEAPPVSLEYKKVYDNEYHRYKRDYITEKAFQKRIKIAGNIRDVYLMTERGEDSTSYRQEVEENIKDIY